MAGPKKYHLTEAEVKNIQFRRMVHDFLSDLVNNETGQYIYTTVRPRLNLPDTARLELSEDGKWISEVEDTPEIIKP